MMVQHRQDSHVRVDSSQYDWSHTVPVSQPGLAPSPAALGPTAPAANAGQLAEALIMMVDDEELNIEMMQAFLGEAGYQQFVHTCDPEQALPLLRLQAPGVLLLDLSMPRVGGLEILAQMQADPVLRHVPTIVLTSSIDASVKLQALAAGAVDFLSKPVDPSELALRIRNTLAASAYRDFLANHDPLTSLPNKTRYRKEAGRLIAHAIKHGHRGALVHVGVDGLGRINDALGRDMGDQLLQRLARRLASFVQTEAGGELSYMRHDPSVYRFDGDEFAIAVPHLVDMESTAAFLSKLLEETTLSFNRNEQDMFLACTIGLSVFPDDGDQADVLIRNAGAAMRHAKQGSYERYEFFSPEMNDQAVRRLDFGADLRHAFARDEMTLLYAPRIEVHTGRLTAAQCVPRWTHGSGRVIEGDELLELAGATDMAASLIDWTLDQLMLQWHGPARVRNAAPRLAVKVSLAQLPLRTLLEALERAIGAGLDPRRVTLELQHVFASERMTPAELAWLANLRREGFRFSLEQFGSGTSMTRLRTIRVDEIKIDASFLEGLDTDPLAQSMLLGMSDFAERVRLNCVACGVNTREQLEFLRRHGWDQAQGEAIGGPLAADTFAARHLLRTGLQPAASAPVSAVRGR